MDMCSWINENKEQIKRDNAERKEAAKKYSNDMVDMVGQFHFIAVFCDFCNRILTSVV